jgi:hypothetical protein
MTDHRAAALPAVWPCRAPTALVDLSRLGMGCGVARFVLKDEGPAPNGDDA